MARPGIVPRLQLEKIGLDSEKSDPIVLSSEEIYSFDASIQRRVFDEEKEANLFVTICGMLKTLHLQKDTPRHDVSRVNTPRDAKKHSQTNSIMTGNPRTARSERDRSSEVLKGSGVAQMGMDRSKYGGKPKKPKTETKIEDLFVNFRTDVSSVPTRAAPTRTAKIHPPKASQPVGSQAVAKRPVL